MLRERGGAGHRRRVLRHREDAAACRDEAAGELQDGRDYGRHDDEDLPGLAGLPGDPKQDSRLSGVRDWSARDSPHPGVQEEEDGARAGAARGGRCDEELRRRRGEVPTARRPGGAGGCATEARRDQAPRGGRGLAARRREVACAYEADLGQAAPRAASRGGGRRGRGAGARQRPRARGADRGHRPAMVRPCDERAAGREGGRRRHEEGEGQLRLLWHVRVDQGGGLQGLRRDPDALASTEASEPQSRQGADRGAAALQVGLGGRGRLRRSTYGSGGEARDLHRGREALRSQARRREHGVPSRLAPEGRAAGDRAAAAEPAAQGLALAPAWCAHSTASGRHRGCSRST